MHNIQVHNIYLRECTYICMGNIHIYKEPSIKCGNWCMWRNNFENVWKRLVWSLVIWSMCTGHRKLLSLSDMWHAARPLQHLPCSQVRLTPGTSVCQYWELLPADEDFVYTSATWLVWCWAWEPLWDGGVQNTHETLEHFWGVVLWFVLWFRTPPGPAKNTLAWQHSHSHGWHANILILTLHVCQV